MTLCPRWDSSISSGLSQTFANDLMPTGGRRRYLKDRELGLIKGFLLCLSDSEAVRQQSSRWKEASGI